MVHRYIPLPFAAEGFASTAADSVTVGLQLVAARVDLATGTVASVPSRERFKRGAPPDPSRTLGGLAESVEETDAGPVTHLGDIRIAGQLTHAWRRDRFLLGVVEMPGPKWDAVAIVLGSGVEVRLPAAWRAPLAGDGDVAACANGEALHVFRFDGGVRVASVALPPSRTSAGPEVFVAGSRVHVVCGPVLVVVEASELAEGPQAITYEPLVGSASGDAEPATVTFALAESLLLDHPRLGRLRVARSPGDPAVAKGDRVVLEDVREELPGIFKVHAWRKAGAGPSVRPAPPPLVLPAPVVAHRPPPANARRDPRDAPPMKDSERLKDLATRHGFRAPERLVCLLEEREADPVFRRWLDKIGLDQVEVRSLTGDWDADPSLLAFCGLGNGDEYALYIYPPWCREGHEPPVVEFLHETNFVEFRALAFDAFLDEELERRRELDGDLVDRIRARLDLPRTDRDRGEPPPWLPVDGTAATTPERAALVAFLRGGDPATLRRLYRELGWTFALENIARSGNLGV